jgi:hypothetical protein
LRRLYEKNRVIALLMGAGLLLSSVALMAHHSVSAEFDTNKKGHLYGTVKKIDLMNPHIYTHVEVKEPNGSVIVYKVEGGAPNSLYRRYSTGTAARRNCCDLHKLQPKQDARLHECQRQI